MDANSDGVCKWQRYFAFTYPVIVDKEHPHAVLYDDLGTEAIEDDIYHHAFQIGFNSPIAKNTTNSFNLKRWFSNESTSAANSPGFNIQQALEFFPDNGNNNEKGYVKVVEQELTIAERNGDSYVIKMSGDGRYHKLSESLFEISLTLQLENEALFGGAIQSTYKIYNSSNYPGAITIEENCLQPYEL